MLDKQNAKLSSFFLMKEGNESEQENTLYMYIVCILHSIASIDKKRILLTSVHLTFALFIGLGEVFNM